MKKWISYLLAAVLMITAAMPLTALAYTKEDLTRTLLFGTEGDDVMAAQELLSSYGYYKVAADGVFSEKMTEAVILFQRANKLVADGKIGKKTWGKMIGSKVVPAEDAPSSGEYEKEDLKRIVMSGCTGNDVSAVQERLAFYGYYSGIITDKFTSSVKNAVVAFQRANNLKADGKVGPNTWNSLISSGAVKKGDAPASQRLEYGDSGDLVKKAQERLAFFGYYTGNITEKFGNTMKQAVIKFQRRNGLKEDGVIGKDTWAKLNDDNSVKFSDPSFETIEMGMTGEKVEQIQYALRDTYYYTGKVDGIFSSEVRNAVRLFQSSEKGLTVDGKVGEKTWSALVSGNAGIFNGAIPVRTLSRTSRGYDVFVLQARLVELNFLKMGDYKNGYYDDGTVNGVKSFQKANHIVESGTLDTNTRRYLWPNAVNTEEEEDVTDIEEIPKLRLNNTGKTVSNAQMRLKSAGYLLGNADGIFGPETENAVKALQSYYGLYPDGVIGVDTWNLLLTFDVSLAEPEVVDPEKHAVLTPTRKLHSGCSGTDVKKLQQQLIQLNVLASGEDDGRFGPITKNAVIEYQKSRGLYQDGIVGIKTLSAIYAELGSPDDIPPIVYDIPPKVPDDIPPDVKK